jgi:putative hydrolase of the HAD superfamily
MISGALNSPYRAILLDWGGVFTPPRKASPSTRRLEISRGIPEGTLSRRLYDNKYWTNAQIGKISDEEFWRLTLKQFNIFDDRSIAEFKGELFSGERDRLRLGMINLVKHLKQHYTVVLLTNADNIFRPLLETKFHADRLFDRVIISAEVGIAKPDPRIFWKACQIVNAKPVECIFVDDSLTNIQSAKGVGIYSIQYENVPGKNTTLLKKELGRLGLSV